MVHIAILVPIPVFDRLDTDIQFFNWTCDLLAMGTRSAKAKKSDAIEESRIGINASATTKEPKRKDSRNIWEEFYPLIQPANQYHHHRNGFGGQSYFFHGMFSSDVTCAYRDAVLAFLVVLLSLTTLTVSALIFCKQWGTASDSILVFSCRLLWLVSPALASFALRHGKRCVHVCRVLNRN